jgi:RNA polymerase sigma-70 factor (ECF subfamily)
MARGSDRPKPRGNCGRALGIDEANVRVRLHRARLALKQRLIDTCHTCPEHGFLDCGCDRAVEMRAGLPDR